MLWPTLRDETLTASAWSDQRFHTSLLTKLQNSMTKFKLRLLQDSSSKSLCKIAKRQPQIQNSFLDPFTFPLRSTDSFEIVWPTHRMRLQVRLQNSQSQFKNSFFGRLQKLKLTFDFVPFSPFPFHLSPFPFHLAILSSTFPLSPFALRPFHFPLAQ